MRKIGLLLVFIAISILLVIIPWRYVGDQILGVVNLSLSKPASLVVNSKSGELIVYVNDEEYGTTPFEKNDLDAGSYDIRIERVSEQAEFYDVFERRIELEEGAQVVINWDLGPSENFSSGEILFFKERYNSDKENSSIFLLTLPNETEVFFDGAAQEGEPYNIQNIKEGKHKVKVTKAGYIDSEFDIQTKDGFDLFMEVRLFPIPFEFEQEE